MVVLINYSALICAKNGLELNKTSKMYIESRQVQMPLCNHGLWLYFKSLKVISCSTVIKQ